MMDRPSEAESNSSVQFERSRKDNEFQRFMRAYSNLSVKFRREPSRQSIGVVDIVSKSYMPEALLREELREELIGKLQERCHNFCSGLYQWFISKRPHK